MFLIIIKYRIQDKEYRIRNIEYKLQNTGLRIQGQVLRVFAGDDLYVGEQGEGPPRG